MLDKFLKYISDNQLFDKSQKVLLAVSGGKDSMAMLHLFKATDFSFGVAHCNFKLRKEDANKDERLVQQFCENHSIPFHSTAFNTQQYAKKNKLSIQMAARELRYNWFQDIKTTNNYAIIATAHHKNDVAETMLINLTKGTGLSGLHGIKNIKGIVRPLLCFTRGEIDEYVSGNEISYREDASNADTKYLRNAIRHKVMPELEKLNSNVAESIVQTADYISDAEEILFQKIEEELVKCTSSSDENKILFSIEKLRELKPLHTYLYYFLQPFGFNGSNIQDIVEALDSDSGKVFYSETDQLVKDREYLILTELDNTRQEQKVIHSLEGFQNTTITFKRIGATAIDFNKPSNYAFLDLDKLTFPLIIRNWEQGDVFQPLGMTGKKKLSDFFIDEKVDLISKQKSQVLVSSNQIVWIIGYRIDDNFKISDTTKEIVLLKSE